MRKSIAQFMWGFQPHFRSGLERATRDVFEQIGFGLGARTFLVGFTDDPDRPFPICFEPEHDPLASVDLSSVVAEAHQRYADSDESRTMFGSRRHHERIHRGYIDTFRGDAIRDALAGSPEGSGLTFYIGSSALVDGAFEVHPVIAVPTARWESKPVLSRDQVDRYPVVPSFQHALMRELLRAATDDLNRSEPPEDFSVAWSDRSELIRKAACFRSIGLCVRRVRVPVRTDGRSRRDLRAAIRGAFRGRFSTARGQRQPTRPNSARVRHTDPGFSDAIGSQGSRDG